MSKLIWFLCLAVLGVLLGLIWGVYDYKIEYNLTTQEVINGLLGGTESSTPLPPQPSEIVSPALTSKTINSKPTSPVSVIAPILSDAQKLYEQLCFQEAQVKLEVLVDKVHGGLAPRYYELKQKCDVFSGLISEMAPGERLPLEGFTQIQLTNGSVVKGYWVAETEDTIILKVDKEEVPYPRDLIDEHKKFSREERYQQLFDEYQQRLNQLGQDVSIVEQVKLGVFCYKHQLNEYGLGLLEKALHQDPDLLNTIREKKAHELYEAYQYLLGCDLKDRAEPIKKSLLEKYPETKYARWIKQGKTLNVVPPKARIKTEEGDKYFEQGKVHLRNTFKRGPEFDKENKAVAEALRQALECYREAQILDPQNIELQNKIREVNQCLMLCRQQTRKTE